MKEIRAIVRPQRLPQLREALRKMYLIRRFEEGAEESYMRGLIHGTMHLSIGQEAVAVGIVGALQPHDTITSTHRGKNVMPSKTTAPMVGCMAKL